MNKNVLIYSNCAGNIIKHLFERHNYTKDKYKINYIYNYENLHKEVLDNEHINLLNNCDIFIYQPFNKDYSESEYDITEIKKYLNNNTIIIKISFYRFRGFWYNSKYKPFNNHNNYKFSENQFYGIHDSFKNYESENKQDIIKKINNIDISIEELSKFFINEIIKLKNIDDNSDVDMFDYFIKNYKDKHLFHDTFHPTNIFFYEIFRQLILKLDNYELPIEDNNFMSSLNDIEMTHWASPILPIIKNILELKLDECIYIFHAPHHADKKLYMNVYDYYYIRLSHNNFQNYLNNL
jgi:hypothetical protein